MHKQFSIFGTRYCHKEEKSCYANGTDDGMSQLKSLTLWTFYII